MPYRKSPPRGQRGLTLLEVAVGIVILTGLTLSTTLISLPISRQVRTSREVTTANGEVRRILERVHAVPFSSITSLYPDGTEIPIITLQGGKIVAHYVDPDADPLVLRLSLSWNSPNLGPMSRNFVTVITR